jgi:hypothetical protein
MHASDTDIVNLEKNVVAIHKAYCLDQTTALRFRYDWSKDSYLIYDQKRIYFYADFRQGFSKKSLLLDSCWHPVGNVKKSEGKWRIYRGDSSAEPIGEVDALFFSMKLSAKVKLRNGDVLRLFITGKGMEAQIYMGTSADDGILIGKFDTFNDNNCKLIIGQGMDISLVCLLFLIYHSKYRR